MHIHILGICGTFMGGLALVARSAGHKVTGCDASVYPPMSTQLEQQGIELIEGFGTEQLALKPDLYIVGNVITRGNLLMEAILNQGLPYTSGPQWLGQHILQNQHVLAVAGTHGKTTTSSMLAWILQSADQHPNFLIGGVAPDLDVSARYRPESKLFVIEADEYDTAFFDKRSKFVHYRPRTVILNNLEYDHADIFPDLEAIQRQFHHLVRIVPSQGLILSPANDSNLQEVLAMGCWSKQEFTGYQQDWEAADISLDGSQFTVVHKGQAQAQINYRFSGRHNVQNALMAIAAAHHVGIGIEQAVQALNHFTGIKRRMELRATINQIKIYDDFAHHPTAIATTLDGLRHHVGKARIIAVLEPRSNTMKLGTMAAKLPQALAQADAVFCYGETHGKHALGWDPEQLFGHEQHKIRVSHDVDQLVSEIAAMAQPQDHIVIMSNGSFANIHNKLIEALKHPS
ncbi:UDP-N-acetylmuramate:L-alanyl-gamma-D-glutamyl-meso-diaminopimelate ligase [Brackiella oedipodis]|uniref:UDP-N-acetylmuramate:L-alanyl-gamma-D-glutamyl- meso-diaminopimelate ligase n=1 Tax=Brackiella oedipodis TaxID=124225 RepID=UPI0004915862|nr:UDP-N-acetylmuramate:L-alanyl-gamma-D-glutamyl-meso-diaminopimelate ligase [Brackiella oedipodis]